MNIAQYRALRAHSRDYPRDRFDWPLFAFWAAYAGALIALAAWWL